ncbi:MAG: hypothetical protein WCP10_15565 [Desulfuromonadales bacterium]
MNTSTGENAPPGSGTNVRAAHIQPEVWFDDLREALEWLSDSHRNTLISAVWAAVQKKRAAFGGLSSALLSDAALRIVFVSVSDGKSPATVVLGAGNGIREALESACKQLINHGTVVWLKLDLVNRVHDLRLDPTDREKTLYGMAGDKQSAAALLAEQPLRGELREGVNRRFMFTAISIFTDGRQTVPLYRGHRMFTSLSCDILLNAAEEAGRYLAEAVNPEGRFAYIYQPRRNRVPDGYNILRHAGSIYALLELYQITKTDYLLKAAERAIAYLQGHIHHGATSSERLACVVEGGYTKLGGNALAILAFAKYMDVTGDMALLKPAQELACRMCETQLPSGNFSIHKQSVSSEDVMPFVSEYYPGEAIFALTRLYQLDKQGTWLDAAEKGACYLITGRDKGIITAELIHDHWFLYALNELYRLRPEPMYSAHAFNIVEAIIGKQNRQPRYPDWLGSYYEPPRSTPVAVRSEGLCAAYQLAQLCGRQDLSEKILASVHYSVCFQLQTQIQPESALYVKNPSRCLGGFRRSLDSHELRIDYTQHNISALLGLYKIMLKGDVPHLE